MAALRERDIEREKALEALARHVGEYVLYTEPDGRFFCTGLGVLPVEVSEAVRPYVTEGASHA